MLSQFPLRSNSTKCGNVLLRDKRSQTKLKTQMTIQMQSNRGDPVVGLGLIFSKIECCSRLSRTRLVTKKILRLSTLPKVNLCLDPPLAIKNLHITRAQTYLAEMKTTTLYKRTRVVLKNSRSASHRQASITKSPSRNLISRINSSLCRNLSA